jgi:hypothetical protein
MAKTFRQRVAQAEAAAKAEELRLHQEVKLILPPMFDCLCSSQFGEIFVLTQNMCHSSFFKSFW